MIEPLNKYIEHTLLKPDATDQELVRLFDEAIAHKFLGVCVNPCNVSFAKKYLENTQIKIVTVIGFPLGSNLSVTKAFETQKAIEDGADEVDMVINVGKLKGKEYDFVENDIIIVRKASIDRILKVILETDLLTSDEIQKACNICVKAGADMVKTSTGFVKNGVGAKVEDVLLMSNAVKSHGLQVKASAGIKDQSKAIALIKAGATRLGTSSGAEIVS